MSPAITPQCVLCMAYILETLQTVDRSRVMLMPRRALDWSHARGGHQEAGGAELREERLQLERQEEPVFLSHGLGTEPEHGPGKPGLRCALPCGKSGNAPGPGRAGGAPRQAPALSVDSRALRPWLLNQGDAS